jgi:hypothetical protein
MRQEEAGRPTKERPASELTGAIVEARAGEVNTSPLHPRDKYRTGRRWHFSPYELFILGQPLHPEDA